MKKEFFSTSVKVQQSGNTLYINLPAQVRSILEPKKSDEIEFVIYDDRSVEIRMKE